MTCCSRPRRLLRAPAFAAFVLAACLVRIQPAVAQPQPAYVLRGDKVEALSREYDDRLQRFYGALSAAVKTEYPDLYARLETVPPEPYVYGYGLLPKLLRPAPGPKKPAGPPQSARYSWPWTGQKIADATRELDALRANFERAVALHGHARRQALEQVVRRYPDLTDAQRNIGEHVRYNRQWQAEIAARRAEYDRTTHFHDLVLEQQRIRDALAATTQAAFAQALEAIPGLDRTLERPQLEAALRARESADAGEVREELERMRFPTFLRVVRKPHRAVVEVRVYTDVEDVAFLERFRRVVEETWHLREGGDEFRIELALVRIPARQLYRDKPGCEVPSAPGCAVPKRGEHIDLLAHAALFPKDGARLTTGAGATHVEQGTIFLGPGAIDDHVLAHEFGHVLGFRDEYFRGYRDLGEDGFEVMEVVADPEHLMGNPKDGTVSRRYFDRLLAVDAASDRNPAR